jgi:Uma2 family endonuclease
MGVSNIGETVLFPPRGSAPINLDEVGPPTLVVEIASTTLTDDLGHKRLLYERLGVLEYWVVDVVTAQVFAFEILEGRSGRIQVLQVLPGLTMDVLEEALRRGQTEDDGAINRWLLQSFAPSP